MALLEVRGIDAYYADSHILYDLSLDIAEGEVVCLLGRNGAGKTTTLKSIIGLVPPRGGRIALRGEEIAGLPPFRIARLGIGYVPEDRRVFGNLTVAENLEVARRTWANGAARTWTAERVFELFPHLRSMRDRFAGGLSGGEQRCSPSRAPSWAIRPCCSSTSRRKASRRSSSRCCPSNALRDHRRCRSDRADRRGQGYPGPSTDTPAVW